MPRVTVVIPLHNGAAFIGHAIRSVLAQTWEDLEIVVADDGSRDDGGTIVAAFGPPVRLIQVRHGNTQATRNAAIAASDSEFVALLDQDDAWKPDKLARQLACLRADPTLGLCYTDTRGVDAAGRELAEGHNPLQVPADWSEALGRLLRLNYIAASSVLMRRSALKRVGTFDPAYHLAGDWDQWLRIAEEFPLAAVPEVLIDYCWHGGNASRGTQAILTEAIAIQEAALARVARHPHWSQDHHLRPWLRPARTKLAARHSELGVLLARDGRRSAALASHARALRLRPLMARAWTRWGRALLSVGGPSAVEGPVSEADGSRHSDPHP